MENIIKALAGIACFGMLGVAQATPVTITFTADNLTSWGGICDGTTCMSWSGLITAEGGDLGALANWQTANSVTVDLGHGDYRFWWQVDNLGVGGTGNPAGLLAEIVWDGNVNSSSSAWRVNDEFSTSGMEYATEYGANGGANIWTSVNGGAISGISGAANWIWTDSNFSSDMDTYAFFRATIHVVPEPATLALFGLGLVGLGFARRRKV